MSLAVLVAVGNGDSKVSIFSLSLSLFCFFLSFFSFFLFDLSTGVALAGCGVSSMVSRGLVPLMES